MTAAARRFWPSVSLSPEKRRPAPFGRLPDGRSTARAASAIAGASSPAARGRTTWNSAQPAVKPEMPSSVGPFHGRVAGGPEIFAAAVGETASEP